MQPVLQGCYSGKSFWSSELLVVQCNKWQLFANRLLRAGWQWSCSTPPTQVTRNHHKYRNWLPPVPVLPAHLTRNWTLIMQRLMSIHRKGLTFSLNHRIVWVVMWSNKEAIPALLCDVIQKNIIFFCHVLQFWCYHVWIFWRKKPESFSSSLFNVLLLSNQPVIISSDPLPHSCIWILFACLLLQLQVSKRSLFLCKAQLWKRGGGICYL